MGSGLYGLPQGRTFKGTGVRDCMLSPSEPKLGVTLLLRTWGVGYVTPTPPRDRAEEVEWGEGGGGLKEFCPGFR